MSELFPGAVLALALRGGQYFPEQQAKLDALIAEVGRDPDLRDLNRLPPTLHALFHTMYGEDADFLEYACDTYGLHDELPNAYDDRDWSRYVLTHPSYLRLFAFYIAIQQGLSGDTYWRLLRSLYADEQHSSNPYLGLYRAVPERERHRRAVMTAEELEVFDALPEIVTLYRGARPAQRCGMSWTLDLEVAAFFAKRHVGHTYTAPVPRAAVMAYHNDGRLEAEVLVNVVDYPLRIEQVAVGARLDSDDEPY